MRNRSPKVLFDLIQRTKDAVRELDNQIGSRFKKLLVESPASYHAAYQPAAAAAAADDDDDDDDEAADDSSVSVSCVKLWDFKHEISRPGKFWRMIRVLESMDKSGNSYL